MTSGYLIYFEKSRLTKFDIYFIICYRAYHNGRRSIDTNFLYIYIFTKISILPRKGGFAMGIMEVVKLILDLIAAVCAVIQTVRSIKK